MSEKEKKDVRINNDRFRVADFTLGKFDAKVEQGVEKADLLKPEFWSHVSEQMTPWSEITVRCEDGTYYAKLLVLDCGRGWAKTQLLHWYDLTSKDVAQSQSSAGSEGDYEIAWKGPTKKFIVLRKSDEVVLHEGEALKESAKIWLNKFLTDKAKVERDPSKEPT